MTGLTTAAIIALLIKYRYLLIFPIAVLEGPIISMVVGFLIYMGYLNGMAAFGLLILADLVGDSLYYFLGRFGRKRFLHKYGHYIGMNEARILVLEKQFEKNHWKILAVGKTQAIGSLILVAAGVAKAPFDKFLWYNLLGSFPKVLFFILVGYFFGHGYLEINRFSGYTGWISISLSVLLVLIYLAVKLYLKKKNRLNGQ